MHVAAQPQLAVLAAAEAGAASQYFPLPGAGCCGQRCCDHRWSWWQSLLFSVFHAQPGQDRHGVKHFTIVNNNKNSFDAERMSMILKV